MPDLCSLRVAETFNRDQVICSKCDATLEYARSRLGQESSNGSIFVTWQMPRHGTGVLAWTEKKSRCEKSKNNQGLLGILAVLTQFHTHKFPQIAARLRMKAFPEPGNGPLSRRRFKSVVEDFPSSNSLTSNLLSQSSRAWKEDGGLGAPRRDDQPRTAQLLKQAIGAWTTASKYLVLPAL